MNTQEAATFAIDTVKAVKAQMIEMGIADEQFIYATCRKLAAMLSLDLDTVVEIFAAE